MRSPGKKWHVGTTLNGLEVVILLSGEQFCMFLSKLVRDIDLILFIVIYGKFVWDWTFFRIRPCPMTWLPYPDQVSSKIFKMEKTSHVAHQSTPKTQQSSFLVLLISFSSVVTAIVMVFKFLSIGNIHGKFWLRNHDVIGHDRILKKVQPSTNFP